MSCPGPRRSRRRGRSRDSGRGWRVHDPGRGRADQPRRALVRRRQPASPRAHRLPGLGGRRRGRERRHGPAPAPGVGEPRQGHLPVHQLPGRVDQRTAGDLRTMRFVRPDVSTLCRGQAGSAAAVLLAAGAPGKRYALRHLRMLLHQPAGRGKGRGSDIEVQARELLRVRETVEQVVARHTGRPPEQVRPRPDPRRRRGGRLRLGRRGHDPAGGTDPCHPVATGPGHTPASSGPQGRRARSGRRGLRPRLKPRELLHHIV